MAIGAEEPSEWTLVGELLQAASLDWSDPYAEDPYNLDPYEGNFDAA